MLSTKKLHELEKMLFPFFFKDDKEDALLNSKSSRSAKEGGDLPPIRAHTIVINLNVTGRLSLRARDKRAFSPAKKGHNSHVKQSPPTFEY